ncbi:hypothetical protein QOZ80_2BG0194340 [Eleusine coracana subsp. coracana]|nr:hypothetical protein QOZ80_2BG0194340 [Eleusine coracana subsp. coracana]
MEIDALVQLEMERMRLGLQETRQHQFRAVVSAVERAASGRLCAAELDLERARCRNAELEEQLTADGQAWLGVAAGLRATLDELLLQ